MALVNFTRILTWADFPNRLPEPAEADRRRDSAKIGATWRRDIEHFVPKGKGVGIDQYTVEIYLVPDDCAVLQSILTQGGAVADSLLRHEQGHYNIVALGAREFHNRMASLIAPDTVALVALLDALENQINARVKNKDQLYDTQTDNNTNTAQQNIWNAAIAAQKNNLRGNLDGLP